MRVLHTADWHIGHTLNGWGRDAEHELWFEALAALVRREEIDALIVSGDVYDGINPSGAAQRILYSGLRKLKDSRPGLVTVITSGNHDPAGRLEAPGAILESLDVHVVASVRRADEEIDIARHMVPLRDGAGEIRAYACAIPFLRAADLPGLSFTADAGRGSPIVEAARRFHLEVARGARDLAEGLPLIAMGHLHCHGATESEGSERRILIGGEHALPEDVFPDAFDYVALGHLHRHQALDGGRLRYSGSCFPLSAAEIDYDHGVTILDVTEAGVQATHHPLPRPAEMLRLPPRGAMTIEAFAAALAEIEVAEDLAPDLRPLVYANLEATGPAAVLLNAAEKILAGAPVRPAGIRIQRSAADAVTPVPHSLVETTPEDLFRIQFRKTMGAEPGDSHIAAFREAATGV